MGSNWSTNPNYPTNGNGAISYDAIINNGTVNLDVDVALSSLTLNNGLLNGSSNLSAETLTLKNGTLATTGTITSNSVSLLAGTLGRNLTLPATATNSLANAAIGSGSTLTVPLGSTLTANASPGEGEALGPGTINVLGTFVKTGANRFYLSGPFNNSGDVQVLQNNLRLNSTDTHTGTFEISPGAQLELAVNQTFQPTATVSGSQGGLVVINGTATVNSEVSTGYIRMVNGTLSGSGNLHPDHFSFDAGTLNRDLTLPTTATNTIGNLAIASGHVLTVPAGSTLTANSGPGEQEGLGPGTLEIQGTFVKTGSARYYASMPMNNDGDVQVQQNNLRLNNSGTHTGTFEVSNNGQLELAGTQTLLPTATVSGNGGLLVISGTATLNSEVSTNFIRLVSGTLAGNGNLQPQQFVFSAGTIERDLTLPATASNQIANAAIGAGYTLTVPVGSMLTANATPGEGEGLGPGTLEVQGTFVKTGGSRYYVSMPMNNDGDVQVQQNNLRLNNSGTHTGSFEVSSGAQLELAGTQLMQPTSTITGLGGVRLLSGTSTINGSLTTDFLWLSGGTLGGNGSLNPGHFTLDSGTLARDLTLNSSPSNTISSLGVADGFTLTNPSAGILGTSSGTVSGLGSFVNQGVINKTGSTTETFGTFANAATGTVNVQAGTLALSGIGTQLGTFSVSSGATLTFGGQATSNSSLTTDTLITGAGKVNAAQGTLNVPGGSHNDYTGGTTVGAGRAHDDQR